MSKVQGYMVGDKLDLYLVAYIRKLYNSPAILRQCHFAAMGLLNLEDTPKPDFMINKKYVLIATICLFSLSLFAKNSKIDSLSRAWQGMELGDSLRMEVLGQLIELTGSYHDPQKAIALSREMLKYAIKTKSTYHEAIAWQWLGWSFHVSGPKYLDSISICFKKSLGFRKISRNDAFIAEGLFIVGAFYLNRANLDSADKYLQGALQLFERIGDSTGVSEMYRRIGYLNYLKGDYREALVLLYKARGLKERLHNNEGVGEVLRLIGKTYWRLGNLEKATTVGEEVLIYLEEGGISPQYLSTLDFLSMLEGKKGNYENAIIGLSAVIDTAKAYGWQFNMYHGMLNRAESYIALGKYETAINELLQVVAFCERHNSGQTLQATLGTLATAYYQSGQLSDSKEVSERILAMQEKSGSRDLVIETSFALQNLYNVHKDLGDHKTALAYFERFVSLQDSLSSENANRELAYQEYRYKFQSDSSKVAEISRLKLVEANFQAEKQQNRLLTIGGAVLAMLIFGGALYYFNQRKKQAQLKTEQSVLELQGAQSEMKALRSQMNPHFIFNALQSIQLQILSKNSEKANDYLLKFSKLMRSVLENSQYDQVPIEEDMTALSLYMELERMRMKNPFDYHIEIDDSVDVIEDSIPPLILQPFVENAIWHGLNLKSQKGRIIIKMAKEGNQLICSVEDDGIGRRASQNMIQQDSLKKESLGLKITEQRLSVIEKRTGRNCRYVLTDLTDLDGEIIGTKAELKIPVAA